jgi:hypothetical protein
MKDKIFSIWFKTKSQYSDYTLPGQRDKLFKGSGRVALRRRQLNEEGCQIESNGQPRRPSRNF